MMLVQGPLSESHGLISQNGRTDLGVDLRKQQNVRVQALDLLRGQRRPSVSLGLSSSQACLGPWSLRC